MKKQSGFTLIEIAIVLVIIGLLLGGVLKGQELIQSARTRNLISTDEGIRAAFFGFQDRFRALPGDYTLATQNITGVAPLSNGNGNGQIGTAAAGGIDEHIAVWDHLSHAGFINGNYAYAAGAMPTAATSPVNPYAGFLVLIYDAVYDSLAPAVSTARHNLKTGSQIPANILAEIDRKVDDGIATTGSFRFSTHAGFTLAPAVGPGAGNCYDATGAWVIIGAVQTNCGAANLF